MHFIHDVKLYKRQNPEGLFIHVALNHPELMKTVHHVLTDGIKKFLDYAIELKEKQAAVFYDLMADYIASSRLKFSLQETRTITPKNKLSAKNDKPNRQPTLYQMLGFLSSAPTSKIPNIRDGIDSLARTFVLSLLC
ncbi:MAG: hypothetical protein ACXWT3_02465 [Methylococcaceae bacterium]